MYKRFAAGLTAVLMLASSAGLTVFADDLNQDYSMTDEYDEIGYDVLSDDEDDFSSSPNLMVQELLDEVETLEEGGISPQWSGGSATSPHGVLASTCISEFGSNYTQEQLNLIRRCMVYGAYKADTADLHHRKGAKVSSTSFYPSKLIELDKNGNRCYKDEVVAYHAVSSKKDGETDPYYGNYLKYLKCLWKYAKLVNQVEYSNGEYDDKELIKTIKNSVNVQPVNSVNSESEDIDSLLYSVHIIFYHYADKYNINRELTTTEKKYLVVGLGLHLVGDIYAHRGCVPASYATGYKFKEEFVDPGYIYPAKLNALMNEIATGNFYATKFATKKYIDESKLAPNQGVGLVYEDNTEFVPLRYYAATESSKNFVSEILISGNTFHPEEIVVNGYALFDILGQDNQDHLYLFNYTTYLNDM